MRLKFCFGTIMPQIYVKWNIYTFLLELSGV